MLQPVTILAAGMTVGGLIGTNAWAAAGTDDLMPETPLLDAVQREIATYKEQEIDDVASEIHRFDRLAHDYLWNLGVYVLLDDDKRAVLTG